MLARMMCAVSLLALAACTDQQTASNSGSGSGSNSTTSTSKTTSPGTGTTTTTTTKPGTGTTTTATPGTTTVPPATTTPSTTTATPGTGTTGTVTGTTPPVSGAGGVTAPSLSAIQGATYAAGPVSLMLRPDNTFEMRSTQGNQVVQGQYTYNNGVLNFTNPKGDIGGATFPMQCRLQQTQNGFQLTDAGGNCTYFRDLAFKRS